MESLALPLGRMVSTRMSCKLMVLMGRDVCLTTSLPEIGSATHVLLLSSTPEIEKVCAGSRVPRDFLMLSEERLKGAGVR